MPKPLIVLTDLAKKFGHKAAVDKISMSIGQGEVFGFLGANGAGKTTTIRMLCGLTKPTAGRATIDGLDVWRDRFRIRSKFGAWRGPSGCCVTLGSDAVLENFAN